MEQSGEVPTPVNPYQNLPLAAELYAVKDAIDRAASDEPKVKYW